MFNSFTDEVKKLLGGMRSNIPQSLSGIGNAIRSNIQQPIQNQFNKEAGYVQNMYKQTGSMVPTLPSAPQTLAANRQLPKPIQQFAQQPFKSKQTAIDPIGRFSQMAGDTAINFGKSMLFGDPNTTRKTMRITDKIRTGNTITPQERKLYQETQRNDAVNIAGMVEGLRATSGKTSIAKQGFSSLADKKPRFEISDKDARVLIPKNMEGQVYRLDQVLSHDRLFSDYPQLKNMTVTSARLNGADAQFDGNSIVFDSNFLKHPSSRTVRLLQPNGEVTRVTLKGSNNAQDVVKGTLLHEIQHAIQGIEGFARGGSIGDYSYAAPYEKPFDLYQKTSGEVEARTTTARMNLDPQQRATIPPYVEQGIPVKDQIVRFDEGTSMSAKNYTPIKPRGFTTSAVESPNVSGGVKIKLGGAYTPKPNEQLMGEAQALLQEGASIKFNKVEGLDKKIAATMQEAINLDKAGNHEAAANLYNNLAEQGTELGRSVQAFSMLDKMSPEAIAISAARRIKQYNLTARAKIPELTGQQTELIAQQVKKIDSLTGREKNIAINDLQTILNEFIPSSIAEKAITVWKAGLLTSLRTHERNLLGNTIMGGFEGLKDIPGSVADQLMGLRTGKRSMTLTARGTISGSKKGIQAASDIITRGYDPEESINKFDVKRVTWGKNPVEQVLKKYTDVVFRTLGGADKPFWNAIFARSMYDQAGAAAINAGKQGDQAFIEGLVKSPTEDMLLQATKDANYATFKDKNQLTNVASSIKRTMSQNEWGRVVAEGLMPFTGVPSSIVGKTVAYSPIGLVKGALEVGNVVVNNVPQLQRQAAQDLGRGVMGTALFGLGAYLMQKGLMTGQPKDQKEAQQWQLEGKQANSVLINGKWRGINSIGPQNLVVLAGAKYQEEANNPEGSTGSYLAGLGKDQLSQTFLQGVQGPLQAVNDPERYAKSYVGNTAASVIPNIVKDTAKSTDSSARELNTVGDYIKLGIPGVRNTLTPKRDVLGNVIKQEPTGAGAFIDLFNSKTPISNSVVDELSRLNAVGENATPSKLQKTQTIQGVKSTLDPQELNILEEKSGQELTKALGNLFIQPDYIALDDSEKAVAIQKVVTQVRKQVRGTVDIQAMPDIGYVRSKDAPQGVGATVGTYGRSLITDPKQTISAVLDGNPIRKVEGGAVILERKNGLGVLDNGDAATQVDHIIALSLGGSNDESNLQTLTNAENQVKGQVEVYLLKLMKEGKITKAEAQKRDLNWKNEIKNLPKNVQNKLVADLSSDPKKIYTIVNTDTGSVKKIDLSTPIEPPVLTGNDTFDKKLVSKYKSALTARQNNIIELYNKGKLTKKEAIALLEKVQTVVDSLKAPKKAKKPAKITMPKVSVGKAPSINLKFGKTPTLNLKRKPLTLKNKARTMRIKV